MSSTKFGFSGRIENIDLLQAIHMVCVSGQNVKMTVRSEGREGLIFVYGGSITHAEAEGYEGEDAIYRMATWEKHLCEFSPLYEEPELRTIKRDWQYLLLEAARIQDEQKIRRKIKVLIVDDSEFFVKRLIGLLDGDEELYVAGVAKNGSEALELLKSERVDVVVLDIFMPVMKGDTALKHIMLKHGVPVVIMSAFPEGSESKLFEFLSLGAVDVFPKSGFDKSRTEWEEELKKRLKKATRACMSRFRILRSASTAIKQGDQPSELAVEVQSVENLILLIGGEGSHAEWFRLPLAEISRRGISVAFSTLHREILPLLARLISGKMNCKTFLHDEELVRLLPGGLHFLSSKRKWRFVGADKPEGWLVKAFESSGNPIDVASELARSAAEVGLKEVHVVVLSGAGEFSQDAVEDLLERGVRFWIPPLDNMVFSCTAESIIRSIDKPDLSRHVILADSWDGILVKSKGEGGGDRT